MNENLEEDLRFEMSALSLFNVDIIAEYIEVGKKKTELTQLLKLLQKHGLAVNCCCKMTKNTLINNLSV
jgi:hypothetical protein